MYPHVEIVSQPITMLFNVQPEMHLVATSNPSDCPSCCRPEMLPGGQQTILMRATTCLEHTAGNVMKEACLEKTSAEEDEVAEPPPCLLSWLGPGRVRS